MPFEANQSMAFLQSIFRFEIIENKSGEEYIIELSSA